MTKSSRARTWTVVWLWAAAALAVAYQVRALGSSFADPAFGDFGNYFVPAQALAFEGDLAGLYERDLYDRARVAAGIEGLGAFVPHPPANALWLAPLAGFSPAGAKTVWTLILIFGLVASAGLVRTIHPASGWPGAVAIVFGATLATRNAVAFGQPYPLLALLLLAGAVLLERGCDVAAAVALGFGASFKLYVLPVGLLFVRNRKAILGFALSALGPSAAIWLLAGPGVLRAFAAEVLPWLLRGEIQDPFHPGWGSLSALSHRLLRREPDLNPIPWVDAPVFAVALPAFASGLLIALGVLSARSAFARGRRAQGVGAITACLVAASPLVGSYHLVLLFVSVAATAERLEGMRRVLWLCVWWISTSDLMNVFRGDATGPVTPLAYLRVALVLAMAAVAVAPFVHRRLVLQSLGFGVLLGAAALTLGEDGAEAMAWERIETGEAYSAMRPHFVDGRLSWWSYSRDGRRYLVRDAAASVRSSRVLPTPTDPGGDIRVISRFGEHSKDLFAELDGREIRLTRARSNEVDPVLDPTGCGVIFASDRGRGLGSYALYRLSLAGIVSGCGRSGRNVSPPR